MADRLVMFEREPGIPGDPVLPFQPRKNLLHKGQHVFGLVPVLRKPAGFPVGRGEFSYQDRPFAIDSIFFVI